jgi:endo-1,4-beta-D-glucanase Y
MKPNRPKQTIVALSAIAITSILPLTAQAGNRFFPQHTTYTAGTIKPNNVTQASMDSTVGSKWTAWKNAYLKPAGTGQYYVKFDSAGNTVSEAHGYGMLLTAIMEGYDANAKTYFDGLYNYYKAHPSVNNQYLMAWKQNSSFQNVEGADSATDGDMDIAYALLLADKQWGSAGAINYLQAANNIINAIMQSDVNQTLWNLRLGDWATGSDANNTRPSDFMIQHMKAYQAATGDTKWTNLATGTYSIINTLFANNSPNTGLLPDFVINSSGWKPAPPNFLEGPNDGNYNYNSCRTPWRITTDYLITGDTRALSQLRKMNSWIKTKTGGAPANVDAGYTLAGTSTDSNPDNCFTIPFGVSAMVDSANQAWLNAIWSHATAAGTENYYNDSIKVLSMIVMSGNWWDPNSGGGGGIAYQAENAVLAGGTVAESTNGGYNSTGYANFSPNGGSATFNSVDGNGGGTKLLTIRYANGSSASRTGGLTVNGVTTNITFPVTGAWSTWATLNVSVTLSVGTANTIRFTSTGQDLANIDEITVPPSATTPDTYQAENAVLGGGAVTESVNAGFNGTGYVNFPATGGTLTFNNVDGNGGGTKSLAIRYANGSAGPRTGTLTVNGTAVNITFPVTGAWTTWATLNVNITLADSTSNTIQLASTGQDLANIDQITVP